MFCSGGSLVSLSTMPAVNSGLHRLLNGKSTERRSWCPNDFVHTGTITSALSREYHAIK
jgi:hypothetical protein